jgi:DNA-directed RNA polymerase specialized sigma24 family protein
MFFFAEEYLEGDTMSPLTTDSETSLTLMEMLREDPRNTVAWDRFVRRYYPKIHRWCRSWGLQEADAEDVAQDVIAKLTQKMASFRYDQSRC